MGASRDFHSSEKESNPKGSWSCRAKSPPSPTTSIIMQIGCKQIPYRRTTLGWMRVLMTATSCRNSRSSWVLARLGWGYIFQMWSQNFGCNMGYFIQMMIDIFLRYTGTQASTTCPKEPWPSNFSCSKRFQSSVPWVSWRFSKKSSWRKSGSILRGLCNPNEQDGNTFDCNITSSRTEREWKHSSWQGMASDNWELKTICSSCSLADSTTKRFARWYKWNYCLGIRGEACRYWRRERSCYQGSFSLNDLHA